MTTRGEIEETVSLAEGADESSARDLLSTSGWDPLPLAANGGADGGLDGLEVEVVVGAELCCGRCSLDVCLD